MKYVFKPKREADHQVYISNLNKFKSHYDWDIEIDLNKIFRDIYDWIVQNKLKK